MQFAIASYDKDAELSDDWHRVVTPDEMKKLYQDWPAHLSKAVNEVR